MKKTLVAVAAAATLLLTGCGTGPGWTIDTTPDWDMNHQSQYNDSTYCNGDRYTPLSGNRYQCLHNGVATTPRTRPTPIKPPAVTNKQKPNSTSGGSGVTLKKSPSNSGTSKTTTGGKK